ncbi:MAG: organic solvent tolerance ABC transporter substrate-binding protein [Candidatus Rokuibacteriota bacterium]|nr:MAG: organic solvent tolerance ABC transporter substrate-binding protein [Candidatus Rokubacteria bacterium]
MINACAEGSMNVFRKFGLVGLVLLVVAAPARAGAPTDQVRQYTDQVLKLLDDPGVQTADKRAAVRKVAVEIFDVQETAKRALGRHWQARTPAEREEFVQLFADLLERTYINKIDLYRGEKVVYANEAVDGEYATVRVRVLSKQRGEIPVDAKMVRRGDRWLIYDIAVENISLIANYRAQFDRIIRTASYQDLVNRLKVKKEEFLQEARPGSS